MLWDSKAIKIICMANAVIIQFRCMKQLAACTVKIIMRTNSCLMTIYHVLALCELLYIGFGF